MIRFLRVVRVINKIFKIGDTDVSRLLFKIFFNNCFRQIYTIALTVVTIIFITAGSLEALENPDRINKIEEFKLAYANKSIEAPISETSFHELIYFSVVTIATVGYGDVTAVSEAGRVCVIIFIILVIVLIPKQTNELLRLMGTYFIFD